jgi:hypothetical protein
MNLLETTPYTFEGLTAPMRTSHLKTMLYRTREILALEKGEAKLIAKNKHGKRMTYSNLPGNNTVEILTEGIRKLESLIEERREEERRGIRDYRTLP